MGSAARPASCVTVAPRKPPPRVTGRVSSAAKVTAAEKAPRGPSEPPSPDRDRRKESREAGAAGGERFSSSGACHRGSFAVARRNAGTTERTGFDGTSMSGDLDLVLSKGEPVALFFVETRDIGKGFGPRRLRGGCRCGRAGAGEESAEWRQLSVRTAVGRRTEENPEGAGRSW
jgi:hypothetical protein